MAERSNIRIVGELYEARGAGDLETVRSLLSEDVVWHEPDVGSQHTGDLRGSEAVVAMISDARDRTDGTFYLTPRQIVANGEHAVAMIDWEAERSGERLEGKEVAVFRIRGGRIVEVSFHQDDVELDRKFWE